MSGNITPLHLYAFMASAGRTFPFAFSIKQKEFGLILQKYQDFFKSI
jgi:hypothetical protein